MEILKLIALFLGASIILTACSAYEKKPLTYQTGAFKAEIEWESGGSKFSATLTAGEPQEWSEDENTKSILRDIQLEFLSPESMKGICISRKSRQVTASLGNLNIEMAALEGYLKIAELFDVSGEVKDIRTIDSAEGKLTRLDVENGEDIFTVYLSCETENPVRIVANTDGKDYDIKIIWFEMNPAD